MSSLSLWGGAAFGLVVGWASLLNVAHRPSLRRAVFAFVFLSAAVAVAYVMSGASSAVEIGIGALTGVLFHGILRAALWRRAHLRSLPG